MHRQLASDCNDTRLTCIYHNSCRTQESPIEHAANWPCARISLSLEVANSYQVKEILSHLLSLSIHPLPSTMLQKASQWAALLASRRAGAMGVQQSSLKLSPLVLSSRGYASATGVAPGEGASPPVHSTPAPSIKTTRLTNLGNVGGFLSSYLEFTLLQACSLAVKMRSKALGAAQDERGREGTATCWGIASVADCWCSYCTLID